MLNYKHGEQKSIQECIEPTERQATKAEDHPEIEMLSILGKLARVPWSDKAKHLVRLSPWTNPMAHVV